MNAYPGRLKVVLAGGSGSLGRRLASDLADRGHAIVVLTRRVNPALPVRQVTRDGRTVGDWAAELDGPSTALINLAGKLVDCRPTRRNIAALVDSRVAPTQALVEASRGRRAAMVFLDSPVRLAGDRPRLPGPDSGCDHPGRSVGRGQ